MAIIHSCCCCKSLRTGSFACGFYTLLYYSFLVIGGTFHVENWLSPADNNTVSFSMGHDPEVAYPVSIAVIICSALTAIASVILLIGLCMDNRLLLLPWINVLSLTTCVDLVYTIYSIGTTAVYPIFAAVVTVDFFICLLNIYCILCVVSQYQEYIAGRGTANDDDNLQLQVSYSGDVSKVTDHHNKRTSKQLENGLLSNSRTSPSSLSLISRRRSSHLEHVAVLDRISECPNVDEVPLKCVGGGGLSIESSPPSQDNTFESLWTVEGDDGVELGATRNCRRGSSTKRVQFHPAIMETAITIVGTMAEGSSSDSGQDTQSKECDEHIFGSTPCLSLESDSNRKLSFSASINETAPLLDRSAACPLITKTSN